jgi:L-amino acid N-acyltransferase YncA
MLSLVREAIKTIEELPYTRLEAQVVADYKEGCRLMEVLGFEKGGLLRKYDQYVNAFCAFSSISPAVL